MHLLVAVLLLQHDGQSLQEGPHAGRHVEADHALLLQGSAARGQHVIGRHELLGAVHHQHVLHSTGDDRNTVRHKTHRHRPPQKKQC